MAILDRLDELYIRRTERASRHKSTNGVSSVSSLELGCEMLDHHWLAIGGYVLTGDREKFNSHLVQSARCAMEFFHRYDVGDTDNVGDGSMVTMNSYDQLLDALASSDLQLAREFAEMLSTRGSGQKHVTPIRNAVGHAVKYTVLDEKESLVEWLPEIEELCQKKENKPLLGYADACRGIADRQVEVVSQGIAAIAEGHRVLAKSSKWYADSIDELLSVAGIGLANLARSFGLNVEPQPPFIPEDLLLPVVD